MKASSPAKKGKTPEPDAKKAKTSEGRCRIIARWPGIATIDTLTAHADKHKASKATGSTSSKPKKDEKEKKIASIFAAPKKAANGAKKDDGTSKTVDKGKKKAAVEEDDHANELDTDKGKSASAGSDVDGSEGAQDEKEEEEMASEEEEEQASKLAAIFTKKVAGSSKGKYGKAIEWKAGEPWVCPTWSPAML